METIQTEDQFNSIDELIEGSKVFYKIQNNQVDTLLKYLKQDTEYTVDFVEGFIQLLNSEPRSRGGKFSPFGYVVKRLYTNRNDLKSPLVRELITHIQATKTRRDRVRVIRNKVIEVISQMENKSFDKEKLERFSKKIVKALLIHEHIVNGDNEDCLIEYYDDRLNERILTIFNQMDEVKEKEDTESDEEEDDIKLNDLEYWCHYGGIFKATYKYEFL